MTWDAANDEGRSRGMDLMTLETEDKAYLLYEMLKGNGKYICCNIHIINNINSYSNNNNQSCSNNNTTTVAASTTTTTTTTNLYIKQVTVRLLVY